MLAVVSQTQSLINILLAGTISFFLIGFGLRTLFRGKRGQRFRTVAWVWFIPGFVGMAAAVFTSLYALQFSGMDFSLAFVLFVVLLGVLIGGTLMFVGWRGQRIGDHPYCRKCGFDLFGRPDGTKVCGECGFPLDAKRAILISTHGLLFVLS